MHSNVIIFNSNLITSEQAEWLREMGENEVDWSIESLYWPGSTHIQSQILWFRSEELASLFRMRFEKG